MFALPPLIMVGLFILITVGIFMIAAKLDKTIEILSKKSKREPCLNTIPLFLKAAKLDDTA